MDRTPKTIANDETLTPEQRSQELIALLDKNPQMEGEIVGYLESMSMLDMAGQEGQGEPMLQDLA